MNAQDVSELILFGLVVVFAIATRMGWRSRDRWRDMHLAMYRNELRLSRELEAELDAVKQKAFDHQFAQIVAEEARRWTA